MADNENKFGSNQQLYDNVKEIDSKLKGAYDDLKSVKVDLRSIVTRGKYAIFYFPVYISDRLTVEEAHSISKLYERVYADFVQNVLSQNNTVEYEELIDDMKFLRKYHTNINESKEVVEKYFGDKPMDFTEKCILSSLCKVGKYFGNKNVMVEYYPGDNPNIFYQEHMDMIKEPLSGFAWFKEADSSTPSFKSVAKGNSDSDSSSVPSFKSIAKPIRDAAVKASEESNKVKDAMDVIQRMADMTSTFHTKPDANGELSTSYDALDKNVQDAYVTLRKDSEAKNEEIRQIDEEIKTLRKEQSEILVRLRGSSADNGQIDKAVSKWNEINNKYDTAERDFQAAKTAFDADPSNQELAEKLNKAQEVLNKLEADIPQFANEGLFGKNYAQNQKNMIEKLKERKAKISSVADARARFNMAEIMLKIQGSAAGKAHEEWMKMKMHAQKDYTYKQYTKAGQVVKDTDIKKINAALPYNITAQFKVLHGPDYETRHEREVVEVNIGVKTMLHIVNPQDLVGETKDIILSGVKSLQKLRYKSGEISFVEWMLGKDRIKRTVQNSVKNARWIGTLRRLANYKYTAKTAFKDVVRATNNDQVPIPNATLVLTSLDVDDIKLKTGFDFTKVNIVKRFCSQMFLISFMIVDASGAVIKMIYPEEQSDWDTMSMTAMEDLLKRSSSADFLKEMKKAVNR